MIQVVLPTNNRFTLFLYKFASNSTMPSCSRTL